MSAEATQRVLLPWSRSCFVCGEANPQGLRAKMYWTGDVVEMSFAPRAEFVGWNNVVHGGLIGTVLDEVMTWAAIVSGRQGFFAVEYGVRLRQPLAPGTPCHVRARSVGERRRIVDTEGWIEDAHGTIFARATGRYWPLSPEKLAGFRHDFVWGEDALNLRAALEPSRG